MSTIVTTPVSPKRPDWQPGHMPRLSYRNPIPVDEGLVQQGAGDESAGNRKVRPGLSIREIREALPRETVTSPIRTLPSPTIAIPQKGKKSFLGNLFVKEPSMAALDQVSQQMLQQHGSVSAKTLPYVSSQKMPSHVPKVNAKWDGVPDHVKTKEKQEKERAKLSRRVSLRPTASRSRSGEIEEPLRRRGSNAGSNADSWDSQSTGSRPMFADNMSMRPVSIYSTSSSGSVITDQRPFSGKSYSSGSFSIPPLNGYTT